MRHSTVAAIALVLMAGIATSRQAEAQSADAASIEPPATAALDEEAPFLAENTVAMDKMMSGMAVKPTGDVDADFTAMMIPHHQGAIDMALAELRYGKNEQLRRIAQEIIVEQQQEIAAMRMALGQPLPPSMPVPTQVQPQSQDLKTAPSPMHMHMHMNKDQSR
ncbi:protein of unknown function [Azospirillum oryzae]|uniref:DUF305 domain-containing protein n=1 Tax=Azospirillum oryzae TaxID=286727 RepID=A0A1X7HS77_9PROT|nr:DUF305 domain-containing protein [Azospirillum oryzae]SMF91827.1 protein of unknown function [Azospirillum oryzae]